jgi:trimethylamine:corrinoid methyltransferase-like protein
VKTVVDKILYDLKVSILQYTAKFSRAISSSNEELAFDVSENVCLNHPLMMENYTVPDMSDSKTQFNTTD